VLLAAALLAGSVALLVRRLVRRAIPSVSTPGNECSSSSESSSAG
jgi:hypothetical protein